MVWATLLGAPLGASAGILAGNLIFGKLIGRKASPFLTQCDQLADSDPTVPFPDTAGKPVTFFEKMLLKDTSPALVNPDYERALFINKILQLLWPHLSPAIHKEIMKQARAPINDAVAKIPLVENVRVDTFDLGERPFRVDSFKTYQTKEDEIIIEAPMFWGGDMAVRVTVEIAVGSIKVDVPVDVANLQFKAMSRITLKPLVETLPCVGGVTLALLEEPTVNFDLHLGESADILCLPGVPLAIRAAVNLVAAKMLVYPNEFCLPLMPDYGLPPPPLGLLRVKVISGHGLKSSLLDVVDPFVTLQVRAGRGVQTSTVANNTDPVWDETIELVVDDPEKQPLKVVVMDDDLVSADIVGGFVLDLTTAPFMHEPRRPVMLRLPIYAPGDEDAFPAPDEHDLEEAASIAAKDAAVAEAMAALPKRRGLIGRLRRKKEAKAVLAQVHGGAPSPRSDGGSAAATDAHSDAGSSVAGAERVKRVPGTVTGSVTLEATFLPFAHADAPPVESAPEEATGTDGRALTKAKSKLLARKVSTVRKNLLASTFAEPNPRAKGVLTVDLKKVMGLSSALDSYVLLRLYDPHRLPVPDIEVKTKVEMNEASPRFNFKTDFVNISASSVLTLTVCSQPGLMDALTSLKVPLLQKAKATPLGRVRVPLTDVVKAGRLKDVYPLHDAQTGEMHLTLEWAAIDVAGEDEEEENEGVFGVRTKERATKVAFAADAAVDAAEAAAGTTVGASGQ